MAITIEMMLKNLGLIKAAKESGDAVGDVGDAFEQMGDASLDATDRAKIALQELYRHHLEAARQTTQVYADMTKEQREQFRSRFDTEEEFYKATQELWAKRHEAEQRVMDEFTAEYKRAFGGMESEARDASDATGRSIKEGLEQGEQAAGNLSDTVGTSLTDSFRGLDGTAEGALTSIADGLTGLVGTASGVGGLIGAAVGTGATIMVRDYFEGAEEAEKRIESMYEAFLESGHAYYTEAQRIDAIKAFLGDESQMARAQRVAETLGVPLEDAVNALIDKNEINNSLLREAIELRDREFSNVEDISTSEQTRLSNLETTIRFLESINEEQDKSTNSFELYNRVLAAAPGGYNDIIDRAQELNAELDKTAEPRAVDVSVNVNTDDAEREVERFLAKNRTIRVGIGVADGTRVIR